MNNRPAARIERAIADIEQDRTRRDQRMADAVSAAIREAFYKSPHLTQTLKGLVSYLLACFEERGRALPSISVAARDQGISERAMTTQFGQLKQMKILRTQSSPGGSRTPIYEPIDLSAVLTDEDLVRLLTPISTLGEDPSMKSASPRPSFSPEASFTRTPEAVFTKPFTEVGFPDDRNDDSRRRRLLDIRTTTTREDLDLEVTGESSFTSYDQGRPEVNFSTGQNVHPEGNVTPTPLRVARDNEAELRQLVNELCILCGPVPFEKVDAYWTAERLIEAIDHYPYLPQAGIDRAPDAWMRLALERGWPINTKIRAAKKKQERIAISSHDALSREEEEAAKSRLAEDESLALFEYFAGLDTEIQDQIHANTVRMAYSIVRKEIAAEHPMYRGFLKSQIARHQRESAQA